MQAERDVLVRLFAARAAVGLPHVDDLAVPDERGEALAEAVDLLPYAERQLRGHVVRPVARPEEGGALAARGGDLAAVGVTEGQLPGRRLVEAHGQWPAGQLDLGAVAAHRTRARVLAGQPEVRPRAPLSRVVGDAHPDDALGRGEAIDCQQGGVEGVAAPLDPLVRGERGEAVGVDAQVADLGGVRGLDPVAHQPEAVGELHHLPRGGQCAWARRRYTAFELTRIERSRGRYEESSKRFDSIAIGVRNGL